MEINSGKNAFQVSVVLTLYNSRQYYRRALASLQSQTFRDFELIIVDDGSTDGIESELLPMIRLWSNVKYIRHSNRGNPLSLNAGIRMCDGNFITFLDSDDEYMTTHLSERVQFMKNSPDVDLIYSPARLVGQESDFFVPDADDSSKLIHLSECVIGATFFGKKKVFTETGGFADCYSHDSEFLRRVSGRYNVERFDSETYVYYRNNPSSIISRLKAGANGS